MASIEPTENGSVDTPKPEPQQPEPTSEAAAAAVVETAQPEATTNTEKPAPLTTTETAAETASSSPSTGEKKWPGWPGDCVFRVIVPVLKVGSIIGRKGDLIKKMCEETRARIRVLDGPVGTPDRVVLISGKEETEAPLSPAMDAVIRVFKRVNGFLESEADGVASGVSASFCSIRLLVASTQAISLIGKQGSLIKSIQESSGASIRVLSSDDVTTIYASSDERIVELQGEAVKVLKALESVVGHLRKFLVDHSVLPLFEKSYNQPAPQERQVESWVDKPLLHTAPQPGFGSDYSLSTKRNTLFLDRETQLEPQFPSSGLSMYGRDPGLSTVRSPVRSRATGPIVTQIAQTMQIPLAYAEDIIGVGGANIAYIRRTSNAILTVQESRGLPDEITVEIKGTSSQVQTAQQLIQECVNNHKETAPGGYTKMDSGLRSSYSQYGSSSYPPSSSFGGQSYGGYGSSGLGGYSSYRM